MSHKSARHIQASFIATIIITSSITIWCLVSIARTGANAQGLRPNDHDLVLMNQLELGNLKDQGAKLTAILAEHEKRMKEMELQVAQAKSGGYTIVTFFGIILTILGISNHFTLRRRVDDR